MNNFDKYWDNIHLKYNSTYDGWLNKYINLINKNDVIIELGCGRAYCSNYLLKNNFKNITACDFSSKALDIVNKENPNLKTMLFDMSLGLPFKDSSTNIIIADLCLHYFDYVTTNYIIDEIYRVLKPNGYLIARVNSANDKLHIPIGAKELEKNLFYDGQIYKKFFDKTDLNTLFKKFKICYMQEENMSRYEKTKILWEFCLRK